VLTSFAYLTPAAAPLLTLAEAKAHLLVDHALDDALIAGWVDAATRACERYAGLTAVSRTARMEFEGFPAAGGPLELWNGPVSAVTAVGHGDPVVPLTAGTGYGVWLAHLPPLVCPPAGAEWPAAAGRVRVDYTCGFGTPAQVPDSFKAAVKLCLAHLNFHRGDAAKFSEAKMPPAARGLLDLERSGRYG
jgi:uncharacterized phiE125 gp8 family phage protein